jgi:hypothetical protein
MSHGLIEPIPGAPALTQLDDWKSGAKRLREGEKAFVSEAPRGQLYELFPDLPALSTTDLTCCRGSPREKIHGACGHF